MGKRRKPYQSVTDRLAAKATGATAAGAAAPIGISANGGASIGGTPAGVAGGDAKKKKKIRGPTNNLGERVSLEPMPDHVQPSRKDYGGMGLAKPSAWLALDDDEFMDKFMVVYKEHVDNFGGKSFNKARRRELSENMLWRVKLREKEGTKTSGPGAAGGRMTQTSLDNLGKGGLVVAKGRAGNKVDYSKMRIGPGRLPTAAKVDYSRMRIGGAQAQKQRTQGPGPGPGAGGSNGAGRQRAKGAVDVDGDARQKVIDLYRSGQRVKKQREKQARMAQRS